VGAFVGKVLEGTALFFGEFDWVRFFSHSLVYSSVRRCIKFFAQFQLRGTLRAMLPIAKR
jgi:hypothetical protein